MNSQGNISFRVSEDQQDQIARAAMAAGKSVSDYARDILVPWAASDLGERPSQLPPKREPSPVARAAAARGMTRDQYRQFAAEALALADLRPQAASSERATMLPPARRAGAYSASGSGERLAAVGGRRGR